jgi:hypothetical protein
MKTIMLLTMLAIIGCTIRIEPLKPKVKYVYRHAHHKKHHATPPPATLVPDHEIKLIPIEPEPTP